MTSGGPKMKSHGDDIGAWYQRQADERNRLAPLVYEAESYYKMKRKEAEAAFERYQSLKTRLESVSNVGD